MSFLQFNLFELTLCHFLNGWNERRLKWETEGEIRLVNEICPKQIRAPLYEFFVEWQLWRSYAIFFPSHSISPNFEEVSVRRLKRIPSGNENGVWRGSPVMKFTIGGTKIILGNHIR